MLGAMEDQIPEEMWTAVSQYACSRSRLVLAVAISCATLLPPVGAYPSGEENALESAITAIVDIGDLDEDGVADLVVGVARGITGGDKPARLRVYSGRTGSLLRQISLSRLSDALALAIAVLDDLTGDGVAEIAVSGHAGYMSTKKGSVVIVDVMTGVQLNHLNGLAPGDQYGATVVTIGDCDGDGVADFAVGAPGQIMDGVFARARDSGWAEAHPNLPPPVQIGYVEVRSGEDGSLLRRLHGKQVKGMYDERTDFFGEALASIGDVDGDGASEFVIGASRRMKDGKVVGVVSVVSCASGEELYSLYGAREYGDFGWSVGALGDIDGDGVAEFAVASRRDGVFVFSGQTGKLLRRHESIEGSSVLLGNIVGGLDDCDDDGVHDYLIGGALSSGLDCTVAKAHVISGANGELIVSLDLPARPRGVVLCSDIDGMGVSDFALVYGGEHGAELISSERFVPLMALDD